MTRLYLTEQGSTAHKRGGRLEVDKDGLVLLRAPIETVEQLVVVGKGIQLSTALLVELLQRGVEVAYLSRSGRYYGKVTAGPGGTAALRAAQYDVLMRPEPARRFAADVVGHKLAAQALHLERHAATTAAAARIHRIRADVANGSSIDQIRGFEGGAAAIYWQALVPLVPQPWGFAGRRHFPAPDPVNALLSFGYTLLLQELVSQINLAGLDASLGALHTPEAGRPSLALDLEEPLRPLGVDTWVFDAVLGGSFTPAQFQRDGQRVLMTPEGRRRFLTLYEQQMGRRVRHALAPGRIGMRQAVELHVRMAARLFSGEARELGAPQWQ